MMSQFNKGMLTGLAICAVIGGGYRGLLYDAPKGDAKMPRTIAVATPELAAVVTYSPRLWALYGEKHLESRAAISLHTHTGNLLFGPELEPVATEIDMQCHQYKLAFFEELGKYAP